MNCTDTTTQNNTISRTWERDGYTLTFTKHKDGASQATITSPQNAPELHVNDYYEVPAVAVNWAAVSNVNSDEAREQAAKIVAAADVVDVFQGIIDVLS